MGGSVSIRAKAQAKAAAAADNEVSATVTGDVTSGTALPDGAVANAGGDSAGDHHTSMVKGKSEGVLEDMESSSTEDGSSSGEADVKCENSAENTGGLRKDVPRLEEISSKGDQEPAKKVSAEPCLRDVACQSECVEDIPDPPMIVDLDVPPPSPQRVYESSDRNPQPSDSAVLPSSVSEEVSCPNEHEAAAVPELQQQQQQHMCPAEGAFPGGIEDLPASDDHKTAAVPDTLAAVGDSLLAGMEVYPQQKCFLVCGEAGCKGARPKVASVAHGEEADCSNELPPVE